MELADCGCCEAKQPEEIKIADVIDAFQQEMKGMYQRIYELESRLRRYDRIFETAFKEELDRRVNGKDDCCAKECSVSPLGKLAWRLQSNKI